MSGPLLPRRTPTPRRIEIGTGEPSYPVTAQDYYRRIYFEAIDLTMNNIDQQFDQPSFDTYAKMESIFIKTLNSQDKSDELKFMAKLYNESLQRGPLILPLRNANIPAFLVARLFAADLRLLGSTCVN